MAITINETELLRIFDVTPSHHNIMLVGVHGIGKSRIITDYYQAKGLEVVTLFLGQMSDPGDLIGLPHLNEKTQRTEFLPPYWFPLDDKPIVLFLDELNRARPEMLQSVMDLALNRKIAGRSLPKGSCLVAAINDGAEYQITELDPALVSRFNLYYFQPTVTEWLLWAERKGLDSRLIEYIEHHHERLDAPISNPSDTIEKSADRRAWERVSDILKEAAEVDDLCIKLIAGIVGSKAAANFSAFLKEDRSLSGIELLLHFGEKQKELKAMKTPQLATLNDHIFRCIEARGYPQDRIETIQKNLLGYMEWLQEQNQREVLMHMINLFSSATYPNANLFFMTEANEVYQHFTKWLEML